MCTELVHRGDEHERAVADEADSVGDVLDFGKCVQQALIANTTHVGTQRSPK
jgi:hypothetical protein